jgi:hypothetical protein
MIFLDSNVFVIDLRYADDPSFAVNRRFLDRTREERAGITGILNVLETCGILSFNLSARHLVELLTHFDRRYGVIVVPGCDWDTRLPAPTVRRVLEQMQRRMSFKDAEIALLVEEHREGIDAFVSWNAKHFRGKLSVPALTPREWIRGPGRDSSRA